MDNTHRDGAPEGWGATGRPAAPHRRRRRALGRSPRRKPRRGRPAPRLPLASEVCAPLIRWYSACGCTHAHAHTRPPAINNLGAGQRASSARLPAARSCRHCHRPAVPPGRRTPGAPYPRGAVPPGRRTPGRHGVPGALPLLRGQQAAQQHPLQHPPERGTGGVAGGAGAEAGAGVPRLPVRDKAAGGPEEPAGGMQGGLGRAGEDAALRPERALLPGAATGGAAPAGPQLLGAAAGAGAGAGPGALRDGGVRGAQHAAEDPHHPAAGRAAPAAGTGTGPAAPRPRRRRPAPALGRRDSGHQGLPGQVLEPGYQHQGVRVPQGDGALQPGPTWTAVYTVH